MSWNNEYRAHFRKFSEKHMTQLFLPIPRAYLGQSVCCSESWAANLLSMGWTGDLVFLLHSFLAPYHSACNGCYGLVSASRTCHFLSSASNFAFFAYSYGLRNLSPLFHRCYVELHPDQFISPCSSALSEKHHHENGALSPHSAVIPFLHSFISTSQSSSIAYFCVNVPSLPSASALTTQGARRCSCSVSLLSCPICARIHCMWGRKRRMT